MGGPCTVDDKEHQELDNFFECSFVADGEVWHSSEQYYQAQKFPDNPEHREQIRRSAPGMASWHEGQAVPPRPDWEEVKVNMMYAASAEKFSQNPALREVLCGSRGPIHAQGGLFWKTWNECLLERLREELREAAGHGAPDAEVLGQRKAAMAAYRAAAASQDQYAMDVATKYTYERRPIPAASAGGGIEALRVEAGDGAADGVYKPDLLACECNGQPHFIKDGMHLYLGSKHGKQAWVLDEFFSPTEATGLAFVVVSSADPGVPAGTQLWQFFNGKHHADREVTITVVGK